jgi:hypothetical protein
MILELMKKRIFFSSMLVVIFMFACQPSVVFDEPQPADVSVLSGFPKRIQGQFLSSDDSSVLEITATSVCRKYKFDMKIHISQLDTNLQLIGDTLFNIHTNEGTLVQIEGDSLVEPVNEVDTLFALNENNVLKKFKGYYFLNIYNSPAWLVKKLELKHGMLTLSSINNKEDLDQLRTLSESPEDTAVYKFSPTRKQFRKFLRNEGFRDTETFTKIRE